MGGFFAGLLGPRALDIPCGFTELGAEGNAEIVSISGVCCALFISDHPGTTWKFSRKPQSYHAVRGLGEPASFGVSRDHRDVTV